MLIRKTGIGVTLAATVVLATGLFAAEGVSERFNFTVAGMTGVEAKVSAGSTATAKKDTGVILGDYGRAPVVFAEVRQERGSPLS